MRQKTLLCSLLLSTILSGPLLADGQESMYASQNCCGLSPHPMRLSARHIEAKGIGYNQGYTTLELFFSPLMMSAEEWSPFIDLRGHVFNNGKFAANAGLGARYLTSSRVWGANFYYDYRKTSHLRYNQVSAGLESLGEVWDFRINGYLPVGTTLSSTYNLKFDHFSGHSAYVSRKREFALKGANAEVGAHVNTYENRPLYVAAGPYYLEGHGKTAWGGELRASWGIGKYVKLEANTSYDSLFKWIGQGQLSLILPFGEKRSVRKHCNSCCTALALSQRAVQSVDRSEIIPVHDKRHISQLLGPNFIFVDNTSHSDGTWESPYPTLSLAQANSAPGDIIYVLPGSGAAYDVTALGGFVMQEAQKLWGSSIPHDLTTSLGTVTIPAMSATMPLVSSSQANGSVITLGNNGEVSGLIVQGNGVSNGLLLENVNALVQNNVININNATGGCVGIAGAVAGSNNATIRILNNQVSGTSNLLYQGIQVGNQGSGILNLWVQNNQLSDITSTAGGVTGVAIVGVAGNLNATLLNNRISNIISNTSGDVIGIQMANGGIGSATLVMQNNQISNLAASSSANTIGIDLETVSSGSFTATVENNSISNITDGSNNSGIQVSTNNAGKTALAISNNQISNISASLNGIGIFAASDAAGGCTFSITGNQITNITAVTESDGIRVTNSATGVFSILDNQVSVINALTTKRGIFVSNTAGTTCLTLIENNAPPSIALMRSGGTFTLNDTSGDNVPAQSETGTINHGPCP